MNEQGRKIPNKTIANLVAIFFIFTASLFVGIRDISVGVDTLNYILNFKKMTEYAYISPLFEPGFQGYTFLISSLTDSVEVYLISLSLLLTFLYLKVTNNAYNKYFYKSNKSFFYFILLTFALIYSSNFFLTANINGIRQGLAAPLIFLFYQSLADRAKYKALIYAIFAISIHYSSVLYLSFFFIIFFSFRKNLFLFIVSSVMYLLGVFEILIKSISSLLGLPIYTMVNSFSDTGLYEGFNLFFFLFSLLPVIGIITYKFIFYRLPSDNAIVDCFKIYFALILPYFILGFAGYTNRYAFTAWLFLPIFFSVFIFRVIKPSALFYSITIACFCIMYFLFLTKMFVW